LNPRLALATFAFLCHCSEPPTERAYEVGVALKDLPQSKLAALASIVPAPAEAYVAVEDPARALKTLRTSSAFAQLASGPVLESLALSDSGATVRALRQRLLDLSQIPLPEAGLPALLDGPLALAIRTAGRDTELLVVKRLAPRLSTSWKLAQMLQSVHASLREVRVERYRGLPLRKVLLDSRRRLTYFVLRDLLVVGTSDAWVKRSLDLALGSPVESIAGRAAVRAALADSQGGLAFAVLDTEAMGAVPGRPGLASLALVQTRWVRATLFEKGPLHVALSRAAEAPTEAPGPPSLLRFAPRGTLLAFSRAVNLEMALTRVLAQADAEGPHATEARALRDELLASGSKTLGDQAFWYCDGVEPADGRTVARHVVGLRLRDSGPAQKRPAAVLPRLLAAPVVETLEKGHVVTCGGEGPALCVTLAGDTLLLSNRPAALRTALAVFDGERPGLALSGEPFPDLIYCDAPAFAAALDRATATDTEHPSMPSEKDGRASTTPALAALKALGVFAGWLAPSNATLSGEVHSL
jgi:hypothetical protein